MKRSSLRQRFTRTLAIAVAVLIVLVAPSARAADPRVVLVVATNQDASGLGSSSAEARIRAELLADGLDVIILVEPTPRDPSTLQSAAIRTHSIAAISVSEQGALARAQIWLSAGPDREAQLSQVESEGEPDERDRLFALRVADFLYASLVELEPYRRRRERAAEAAAAGEQGPSPAPDVPAPKPSQEAIDRAMPPVPAPPREPSRPGAPPRSFPRAAVGLGGTFWAGFGTANPDPPGLGHSVAPTLTGGWWLARRWRIGAILSGPAIAYVSAPEGDATVDQELLAAEAQFSPYGGENWTLHVDAGGGIYRMGTRGSAEEAKGYVSSSEAQMRVFGIVGFAGRLALQHNLWLVVRFDSVLVTERLAVAMAKDPKATTALPLLLGSVGFEVTW